MRGALITKLRVFDLERSIGATCRREASPWVEGAWEKIFVDIAGIRV
jgi:hypothetical protein